MADRANIDYRCGARRGARTAIDVTFITAMHLLNWRSIGDVYTDCLSIPRTNNRFCRYLHGPLRLRKERYCFQQTPPYKTQQYDRFVGTVEKTQSLQPGRHSTSDHAFASSLGRTISHNYPLVLAAGESVIIHEIAYNINNII